MNCHTLDRFRGAWLGSMIYCLIELRKTDSHRDAETGLQFFILREQLAQITIDSQRWDADAIADLLVTTECGYGSRYPLGQRQAESNLCGEPLTKKRENPRQPDLLTEYSYCLLSLLPLIIFYGDNWNLQQKIIRKYCVKLGNSSNNSELEIDTLFWSYLITSILNSELELNRRNFSQLVRKILTNVTEKETALTAQLEIVITAMERGVSLQQLSDELWSRGNTIQSAIALSCYCFATTASDFKLSVQRACNLDPEIAGLATALTATVSGAYNGMTRIPLNWKKMANQNSAYQLASQTVVKLFRAWLGIYLAESEPESNIQIQAIAVPSLIQTRKDLKIISQQSLFD